MALNKTLTANGSKGHHKFSLEVVESSTSGNSSFLSFTFKIIPIQTGWDWDWSGNPSKISYSITIGSNSYTGTIGVYNGSSTVSLKSGSNIEIVHENDGTKTINIGFSVSDTTGVNYTCGNASSSNTFTLSPLHKAPTLNNATMVETNQAMINLGIPDTTIVQYLSKKTITLDVTAYDSATLTYKIRHFGTDYKIPASGYQSSNSFNTDYTQNDIVFDNNKINIMQWALDSKGSESTDYIKVSIGGVSQKPNVIPYVKPGTKLTDNKAVLNLKATIYKNNDIIGNNNSITQIGYKIWEKDASEPANYTTITPTVSGGTITVSNLEISNINYLKSYKYKIILKDNYKSDGTNYNEDIIADGVLSTGQPVWSEYKDHVDFLKITIQGEDILTIIQRMINGG